MFEPRIAVIGAGAWGANHVRVVASEPACRLVAVIDPDRDALARTAGLVPASATMLDVDRALADPEIDAVIIATPAPTHVTLACAALAANKHVLVEKPIALSLADAHRLADAAGRSTHIVMVGHQMLFHPAVTHLRDLLCSGDLGDINYVHSIRANLGRIRRDENVLWTFAPHELSMLDFLIDAPLVSVSARGQCTAHEGVEDVVFVTARFASGRIAHLHLSRIHPRKERVLTLACSRKLARFDDVASDKLRIYASDGDIVIPHLPAAEPLQLQFRHFLDCIRTGARPLTDLASAVRIVEILEAAQRSLALDGHPVACTGSVRPL